MYKQYKIEIKSEADFFNALNMFEKRELAGDDITWYRTAWGVGHYSHYKNLIERDGHYSLYTNSNGTISWSSYRITFEESHKEELKVDSTLSNIAFEVE